MANEFDTEQSRRGTRRSRYFNPAGVVTNPDFVRGDYQSRRNAEIEQGLMPPAQPNAAQAAGNATLQQVQAQQQAQLAQTTQEGKQRDEQFQFASKTGTLVPGLNFSQFSTKPTSTISQGGIMTPETAQGMVGAHHTNAQLRNMAEQSAQSSQPPLGDMARDNQQVATDMGVANQNEKVLQQERDRQWETERVASQKTLLQDKLQTSQLDVEKTKQQLANETQTYAKNQLMEPILKAEAEARLKELNGKAALTEQENKQRNMWQSMIAGNQPQPLPPVVQAQNSIMSSQSLADTLPLHDDLKMVAAINNVPPAVRNAVEQGKWASTYTNPMELATDAGIKLDNPHMATFKNLNAEQKAEVDATMAEHLMPDEALKKIMKESGLTPKDKGYQQLALDFAYGIWSNHREKGEVARQEFQARIAANQAQQAAKTANKIAPLVEQVASPEIVTAILNSKVKTVEDYLAQSESAKTSGTADALYAPGLRLTGAGKVGIDPLKAEAMTPKQIQDTILDYVMEENKTDIPLVHTLLSYKADASKIPEQVKVGLDALTLPWSKGYKEAKEATIKKQSEEQDKQSKIIDELHKQNPSITKDNVVFDPASEKPDEPMVFNDPEEAKFAKTLDTYQRKLYAAQQKELIHQAVIKTRGNSDWLEHKQAFPKIAAHEEEIMYQANLARRNGGNIDMEAISKLGLNDNDSLQKADAEIKKDYFSHKPATGQPVSEPPTLTPEQVAKAPEGTRFRSADGRRGTVHHGVTTVQTPVSTPAAAIPQVVPPAKTVTPQTAAPSKPQVELPKATTPFVTQATPQTTKVALDQRREELRKHSRQVTDDDIDEFIHRKVKETGMSISDFANSAIQGLYGLGDIANKGAELVGKGVSWPIQTTIETAANLPEIARNAIRNMIIEDRIEQQLAKESGKNKE